MYYNLRTGDIAVSYVATVGVTKRNTKDEWAKEADNL
jgi:hypothetical protein